MLQFAPIARLPRLASAIAEGIAALIMIERQDCPWCRRWLREVGQRSWDLSDLGKRAPLRRVDVGEGLPAEYRFLRNWRFTPTFVLVVGETEIGRIIGYQADLFFWQQAEALISRLPAATNGGRTG
jgi:hypothetical protein